jgi:outer membrane receptor for monomeric catechols
VVLTSRPADALTQADAVRKADARFAGLTVSLTNGTLVIAGRVTRATDAWDLAHELKKIPGVTRVALGSVEVK